MVSLKVYTFQFFFFNLVGSFRFDNKENGEFFLLSFLRNDIIICQSLAGMDGCVVYKAT